MIHVFLLWFGLGGNCTVSGGRIRQCQLVHLGVPPALVSGEARNGMLVIEEPPDADRGE